MHHKIFAVDGVTGIFGGRNIGDNYFDVDRRANFSDFDVFVAGTLITEATRSFEEYWVHSLAVPAEDLTRKPVSAEAIAAARRTLRERLDRLPEFKERYDRALEQLDAYVRAPEETLRWARAELVVDPPDKLVPDSGAGSPVFDRLFALWRAARQQVLIEWAYFVPRKEGAKFIAQRAQEGVRTQLLTNSLAANDEPQARASPATTPQGRRCFALRPGR